MADRDAQLLSKSRTIRSEKIQLPSPSAADAATEHDTRPLALRSHTPGHNSSKSQSHSRRKPSEALIRQRSQSFSSKSASATVTLAPPQPPPALAQSHPDGESGNPPLPTTADSSAEDRDERPGRPPPLRATSTSSSKPASARTASNKAVATSRKPSSSARFKGASTAVPPLPDPSTARDVPPAPSSGMYWSRAPVSGVPHTPLRAHTTTLIGSNVYVFGGCDSTSCFNELYVLDADSFHWISPHVVGDAPVPLRAMTCTAVGKKLVIFGGGDGPEYYNKVYVLDTVNFRWHQPRIVGDKVPTRRRAHTACLYKQGIYVFGGGDGVRALNDVWRLDVSDMHKMSWKLISPPTSTPGPKPPPAPTSGSAPEWSAPETAKYSEDSDDATAVEGGVETPKPKARGYHTANMVGNKLIIYGGSDGEECFDDVWVYDVDKKVWTDVELPVTFRRLSHTSTIVGSYLFVIGGHDGNEYSNDVLLLNLVTMTWEKRKIYGLPPSGRGYHGTVLYDSRLLAIGGFDGGEVFGDVWMLELAVHAYYSQISHFTIEV